MAQVLRFAEPDFWTSGTSVSPATSPSPPPSPAQHQNHHPAADFDLADFGPPRSPAAGFGDT
jgi:hypothetical protein